MAVPGSDETADRLAILQLEARYARTWDTQDAHGWAACFTDDGAFEMGSAGAGPAFRAAGREALAEFCRRGSGRFEGIHLLSAPDLDFGPPGTARGWVHFQYLDRDRKTGARRQVAGVYAVTYRRTGEGWRMAVRREQAVMSGGQWHGFPAPEQMWGAELG